MTAEKHGSCQAEAPAPVFGGVAGGFGCLILFALVTSACQGEIFDPVDGAGPSKGPDAVPVEARLCPADVPRVSHMPLRRLSFPEYHNSLRSLFSAEALAAAGGWLSDATPDTTNESPGEFEPHLTEARALEVFEVGQRIATYLSEHPGELAALGASCVADGIPDAGCVTEVVRVVGKRLFRRTLSSDEVDVFVALYNEDESIPRSESARLADVLGAMLGDPAFTLLFLDRSEGRRMAPHAIATRLAFATTGANPDPELLAAADSGVLEDPAEREKHAARLLASPAGRRRVRQLFERWLKLNGRNDPRTAAEALGIQPDGLYDEMKREALDFVEHVVFEERGSYQDLMTAELDFPSTNRLAEIMGQDRSSSAVAARGSRAGLIARPVFLASASANASAILRGLAVIRLFLCRHIDEPPDDADEIAGEALHEVSDQVLSSREAAEVATAAPACAGCHVQINPPGYALSAFGPLGQEWQGGQETVLDGTGAVRGTVPVDALVADLIIDDDLVEVDGASELSALMASSSESMECATRQLFRVTHLREPTDEDACHLGDIRQAVIDETSIFDLLVQNAARESIDFSNTSGRTRQ